MHTNTPRSHVHVHTHTHSECRARTKAGGSPWLQLHDNMPLEIAGLLINPADMTASPRGPALWVPTRRQLPLLFLPTNWWRFLLYMLVAQGFFSPSLYLSPSLPLSSLLLFLPHHLLPFLLFLSSPLFIYLFIFLHFFSSCSASLSLSPHPHHPSLHPNTRSVSHLLSFLCVCLKSYYFFVVFHFNIVTLEAITLGDILRVCWVKGFVCRGHCSVLFSFFSFFFIVGLLALGFDIDFRQCASTPDIQ